MAFHLGVLRFLAERALLERVDRVSTVSGGSLLVGLIYEANKMTWPASDVFSTSIYGSLRSKLCSSSLQWGALRQLLKPTNWRFILSRANLLGLALRDEWSVKAVLSDLPESPEWSVNGTTAENGKRFRFKAHNIGDYELGYADNCADFPLSQALAVSAAFPGGFGPLAIEAKRFKWKKRAWGAPAGTEVDIELPYRKLHLYDGGVYDNLGLEPFFDAGRGKSKIGSTRIFVSDAGAPLSPGFNLGPLNVFRLKRVADIMSDQAHALRVRTFFTYLQAEPSRGALIYIGDVVPGPDGEDAARFARAFPTSLKRLTLAEFDQLAGHGYRVAKHTSSLYGLVGPASMPAVK